MSSMKLLVVSSIFLVLLIVTPTIKAVDNCQCSTNGGTPGFTGPLFGGVGGAFGQCYSTPDTCAVGFAGDAEGTACCECCCGSTNTPSDYHGDTSPFDTSVGCPAPALGGD